MRRPSVRAHWLGANQQNKDAHRDRQSFPVSPPEEWASVAAGERSSVEKVVPRRGAGPRRAGALGAIVGPCARQQRFLVEQAAGLDFQCLGNAINNPDGRVPPARALKR